VGSPAQHRGDNGGAAQHRGDNGGSHSRGDHGAGRARDGVPGPLDPTQQARRNPPAPRAAVSNEIRTNAPAPTRLEPRTRSRPGAGEDA
jgi:hypothetical protein